MRFLLRARTEKSSNCHMKYLGIFLKIRRGDNSARVWVKTATSAAMIVFLVYSVMWCGDSVKCDSLQCDMACSLVALWWTNYFFSFVNWLFFTPPGKAAVLLNNRLQEYKIELKDELDFYYEIDVIFSMGFVQEQLELYTL